MRVKLAVVYVVRFGGRKGRARDMETGETLDPATTKACCEEASVVALTSALTFVAAGTLLGCSFLTRKRRAMIPVQLLLGLVAGGAGVMMWRRRQEELEAARYLMERVHDIRDRRWLKQHPVAYG